MFLIFRRSIVAYIPFKDMGWRGCRSSHTFSFAKSFDIDMTSTFVSSWQQTSRLHPTTNNSRNTKANFIGPPIITIKNIYSWHGTHLKNRKILWSSWDNHFLIHHDHQHPDATTCAGSGADMMVPELTCKGTEDDMLPRMRTNLFCKAFIQSTRMRYPLIPISKVMKIEHDVNSAI